MFEINCFFFKYRFYTSKLIASLVNNEISPCLITDEMSYEKLKRYLKRYSKKSFAIFDTETKRYQIFKFKHIFINFNKTKFQACFIENKRSDLLPRHTILLQNPNLYQRKTA